MGRNIPMTAGFGVRVLYIQGRRFTSMITNQNSCGVGQILPIGADSDKWGAGLGVLRGDMPLLPDVGWVRIE